MFINSAERTYFLRSNCIGVIFFSSIAPFSLTTPFRTASVPFVNAYVCNKALQTLNIKALLKVATELRFGGVYHGTLLWSWLQKKKKALFTLAGSLILCRTSYTALQIKKFRRGSLSLSQKVLSLSEYGFTSAGNKKWIWRQFRCVYFLICRNLKLEVI